MEKTVKLNGEDIRLKSSLFTIIEYRSTFGTELFSDVTKLESSEKEGNVSEVLEVIFKIVYVFTNPSLKKAMKSFYKGIDFTLLSDVGELENISHTIAELLGGSVNNESPK